MACCIAQPEHEMLKIDRDSAGPVAHLRLCGRIQPDRIECIRTAIGEFGAPKVLDLAEVTLVDIEGVRFLIGCEDEGIELAQCPLWVSGTRGYCGFMTIGNRTANRLDCSARAVGNSVVKLRANLRVNLAWVDKATYDFWTAFSITKS